MLALTSATAALSVFPAPAESNLEALHPGSSSPSVFSGSVPNQTSSGATKHDMNPNGLGLGPVVRSVKTMFTSWCFSLPVSPGQVFPSGCLYLSRKAISREASFHLGFPGGGVAVSI